MVRHIANTISGLEDERKELKSLYRELSQKPTKVDYILIQKWDRYFRNVEVGMMWIKKFSQIGIEINAVEQWVPFSQGVHNTFLGFYLGQAKCYRVHGAQRVDVPKIRVITDFHIIYFSQPQPPKVV